MAEDNRHLVSNLRRGKPAMDAALSLCGLQENIDFFWEPHEDYTALYLSAEKADQMDLLLQTDLVLNSRFRERLGELGYDFSGAEVREVYYGMPTEELEKFKKA